jgi:hypothetical protein
MTFVMRGTADFGLADLWAPRRGTWDGDGARSTRAGAPINQLVLDRLSWPYPPFTLAQWLVRVDLGALAPA